MNGWDISRDQKLKLEVTESNYNHNYITFTLSNVNNGSIVKELDYAPLNGGSRFSSGILSQDNSLMAIPPTFEEGFVILNIFRHYYKGNELYILGWNISQRGWQQNSVGYS